MTQEDAKFLRVGDRVWLKPLDRTRIVVTVTEINPFTDLNGNTRPIITFVNSDGAEERTDAEHIIEWTYSVIVENLTNGLASI